MPLITNFCYAFSLKAGTTIILVFYWWMSVTYVVILMNYFSEHNVIISTLIGWLFLIWVACATAALYGVYKRNPYYLISQIISDVLDCIQVLINLIYEIFTGKLLIPRYTTFGATWRSDVIDDSNDSISIFLYNIFDERYPLPSAVSAIDLAVRIYFLLVFVSCFQYFMHIRKKKRAKHKSKRTTVQTTVKTTVAHTQNLSTVNK